MRALVGLVSLSLIAASLPAFADDGRYLVGFSSARGRAEVAARGRVVRDLPDAAAAELTPEAAEALRRAPGIAYVEDDPRRYPLAQRVPYGIDLVQAPLVWASATGANRKICIIDSGFFRDHADLQDSGVTGYPQDWATDRCGHGSHVAGTIAALSNDAGVVGVLPNGVQLHIVKVFGDTCGWSYASDLVDALSRCRSAGAHVVSMSLGGSLKTRTEERAFQQAWDAGVLSIAAAGNDGSGRDSYPASYPSVVSVGAVDASKNVASFSQHNAQVELAAPGVAVLSTISWRDENSLTIGTDRRDGRWIENAARASGVRGAVVDGGRCTSAGAWSDRVVLCERGDVSFDEKVRNVRSGGGLAAVIYNDASGNFFGTLGAGNWSPIPAISLSREDGLAVLAQHLGATGTVESIREDPGSGYEAWDGTSMATPHVSGVAALVWSANPSWTNAQIREALCASAEDLGAAGRDPYYGCGLVQAKAALERLQGGPVDGGGGGGGSGGEATITLAARGYKVKGLQRVDLTWSGATTSSVEIRRNGGVVATTANDGSHTDDIGAKGAGTYVYEVCETGGGACSAEATVVF